MHKSRYYSLFQKQNGKWVRVSKVSYLRSRAVEVYQSSLLGHALWGAPECSLRPVKEQYVHQCAEFVLKS